MIGYIDGWAVETNDYFDSFKVPVKDAPDDHISKIIINSLCGEGYIFEGLLFDNNGNIDTLYFRKEQ